jgi:hypothetical protein
MAYNVENSLLLQHIRICLIHFYIKSCIMQLRVRKVHMEKVVLRVSENELRRKFAEGITEGG